MIKLIDTIKKIENVLHSLESVLKEECHNLLSAETFNNSDNLELIEKKTILFEKLVILNQNRSCLEKKYGIFTPYNNINKLNNNWNKIIKKCFLLRELNLKNKILINKKFHLNQYFLELFSSHKKAITYNINGNLKI